MTEILTPSTLTSSRPSRLILPFTKASGHEQMARDRELCELVVQNKQSTPIVRFYQWTQPTLSLGYHQKRESLDAIPDTLDVVHRPTGGRAVLHQASGSEADITYCIVARGLGMSRRQAYEFLCQFLIDGLERLGISVKFGQGQRGYIGANSCFRSSTAADLCFQGKKMIGSAQRWHKEVVLQHGTILLNPDRPFWETVMPDSSKNVIGINEVLVHPVTVDDAISAFSQAAWDRFGGSSQ